MKVGIALGAVVIVAAICIAYVALSPMTDDPVVTDDGQRTGRPTMDRRMKEWIRGRPCS